MQFLIVEESIDVFFMNKRLITVFENFGTNLQIFNFGAKLKFLKTKGDKLQITK